MRPFRRMPQSDVLPCCYGETAAYGVISRSWVSECGVKVSLCCYAARFAYMRRGFPCRTQFFSATALRLRFPLRVRRE